METKNNWKAWLYLAPVLILMLVFTVYPLIHTIGISFLKNYDYYANETFFHSVFKEDGGLTLNNFKEVLSYEDFTKYALPNTLIIVVVTVPCSIALALLIAVGLNSIKCLNKVFQTIFFMPYVTNSIAVGMVFAVIFAGTNGLWNTIFGLGNIKWVDMNAPQWRGMFALCVYIIWHALPYKILIFLSGLQGIDKQYYQAAKIDSATKIKTFWRVTVPLLSPQIVYILITSMIGSFKEYSSVVAMFNDKKGTVSSNDPNMYTVVYYIYDNIGEHPAFASAAAVLLFIIIMIFTFIQKRVSDKRVHY